MLTSDMLDPPGRKTSQDVELGVRGSGEGMTIFATLMGGNSAQWNEVVFWGEIDKLCGTNYYKHEADYHEV